MSRTLILPLFLIPFILVGFSFADGFHLIGSVPSNNGLYYTTMSAQGIYIAMGDQRSSGVGIDIINVENPDYMFEVGFVYTGHMTYQLAWSGNYIYSPASWDGFFIYDASDFNNLFLIADTSFGEALTTVAIRDSFALVGGTDHMYSLNVGNPGSPQLVWSTDSFGCSDLVLGDTVAYAYLIYEYVVILDISSPEFPIEITRFNYLGVNGVEIDRTERYLYLTAGEQGLVIFNIEDPNIPVFVSSTPMPNGAWCIDVCESEKAPNIVFVSGYTGGLWAVDVSDPENPVPLDNYNSSLWSCYVISKQDIIFHTIADSMLALTFDLTSGFQDNIDGFIFKEYSLWQNYPNPFNATTTIRYYIPQKSEISLTIYDLLGQRIETLFEGLQNPGEHTLTWDASHLPSGIYFARLETVDRSKNIKMVLLK